MDRHKEPIMKQENKEKLKKISNAADTITDNLLFQVSQSSWSWALLLASHALAFFVGFIVAK